MPTLKERVTDWLSRKRALISFGITDETGGMFFIEAHNFTLDSDGRLLFWKGRRVISVIEAGKWQRILEGISLEDFKE